MTNDNTPPHTTVVAFKKRKDKKHNKADVSLDEADTFASIWIEEGMVGLGIENGQILLSPKRVIELCVSLIAAMRIASNTGKKD